MGNRLEIQGHANAKQPGSEYDLVCCACSTLLFCWSAHLAKEDEAKRLKFFSQQIEKGFGSVRATAADGEYLRLKAGFDTMLDGIKLLHAKYPDNITLSYIVSNKE